MPVNQVNLDNRRNNYLSAKRFVNADDRRLYEIANKAVSGPEYRKKASNRNKFLILSLPATIIASAAAGVKAKSGHLLSTKAFAGAGALASLTVFAGVLTAAFAGEKALISNSSTLEDAHKKHPFMSLVADFAVALGAVNLAGKGVGKLAKRYAEKFPETLKGIKTSIDSLQSEMDKTALNRKLLKNVSKNFKEFSKNHALTSSLLKAAVKYSPFLLIGGYLGADISSAKHRAEKRNRYFMDLKDLQLYEAKHMINGLEHGNRNLANAYVAEKVENKELTNKLVVAEMKQEKEDM